MADLVKFIDHTTAVLNAVDKITNEALQKAGDLYRDTAKQECPVKTGALKKAIRVQRLPKEKAVKIILNSKKAFYAHMVLFGTVHSQPNNYALRAIDKTQEEIKGLFNKK